MMDEKEIQTEEIEETEDIEKSDSTEEDEEFHIGIFGKTAICESIILALVVVVCRMWVFPAMNKTSEMHMVIALHSFMIGITATLFSVFAITFRRAWKTHGKYVLLPIIFVIFGFLMQIIATEVSFG